MCCVPPGHTGFRPDWVSPEADARREVPALHSCYEGRSVSKDLAAGAADEDREEPCNQSWMQRTYSQRPQASPSPGLPGAEPGVRLVRCCAGGDGRKGQRQ